MNSVNQFKKFLIPVSGDLQNSVKIFPNFDDLVQEITKKITILNFVCKYSMEDNFSLQCELSVSPDISIIKI